MFKESIIDGVSSAASPVEFASKVIEFGIGKQRIEGAKFCRRVFRQRGQAPGILLGGHYLSTSTPHAHGVRSLDGVEEVGLPSRQNNKVGGFFGFGTYCLHVRCAGRDQFTADARLKA